MLKLKFEKAEIEVRNQLVNQFLGFLAILSTLMVSASLYRATLIGWQPFMTSHLIAGSMVVTSALLRNRLSFPVKAWLVVVLLLLVGLNGFFTLGLISNGHAFILMSVSAATAFFTVRAGIAITVLAMGALAGLSIVWVHHKVINFDPYFYITNPQSWILLIISLFAMTGMSMTVTGRLTTLIREFMMEAVSKADSLAVNEARTEAFLHSAVDQALIATDNNGLIIRWNLGAETMFGYTKEEAMGQSLFTLVLPPQLPSFGSKPSKAISQLETPGRNIIPMRAKRKNGNLFDSAWALGRWFEEGNEFHSIIITDTSERMAYEEKLYQQAHFDTTTHLLNRTGLIETLNDLMTKESSIALVLINFSGLSKTNTSHGHLTGDRLIATVGQKLKSITNKKETLARISACQFAMLIKENSFDRANQIRTQVDALFSHPSLVDQLTVHQEASFGVAFKEQDDLDAHSLLNKAFVALYQAKEQQQSNFATYNRDYNAEAQQKATVLSELHDAIHNEEFELFSNLKSTPKPANVLV